MATYAIGGQPKLGVSVAFQTLAKARLSLSELQLTPTGSERLTLLNVLPLSLRVPVVVTHAGRPITIEWVATEKTSPNASIAENGAPPRCCLSCGGVVLCSMKVEAWCGSCCDPRSAACRPPPQ
jgi:predicted TIM-barrel fold metal-dependent hydrolase